MQIRNLIAPLVVSVLLVSCGTTSNENGMSKTLVGGQTPAADSLIVVPGPEYKAGWLHRLLFGNHYRDLWVAPTKVKVLDMGTFAGGLYRVNYKTGTATQFGTNAGLRVSGLAMNPISKSLYMSLRSTGGTADAIYKIDKTSGVATKIGNTGLATDVTDILFDKNGKLLGKLKAVEKLNTIVAVFGLRNLKKY